MKRRLLATLALFVSATVLHAQKKPNFSGTWFGVSPAENTGSEQIVTHTETTLTTRHASSGDEHVSTYKLDGSESRNSSEAEGTVSVSRAGWDGNKLIITETTTYADGRKVERRQVWSFDDKGQLVIEFTRTIPGSSEARTQVGVYRKK